MAKLVVIWEVSVDTPDHLYSDWEMNTTTVHRFKRQADAEALASRSTCYGRPATAHRAEVSRKLANRWGV